jgi:hypothetical protein
MSAKQTFLVSLAAIILILGAVLIVFMKKMLTPTEGAKIAAYSSPQKALLVIDAQEDFTGLKGKQPVPYKVVEPQIAAYCAYNTAKGALNRGYKVTVVKDAIMTRKNMSDVLKRYEQEGIVFTSSRELAGL